MARTDSRPPVRCDTSFTPLPSEVIAMFNVEPLEGDPALVVMPLDDNHYQLLLVDSDTQIPEDFHSDPAAKTLEMATAQGTFELVYSAEMQQPIFHVDSESGPIDCTGGYWAGYFTQTTKDGEVIGDQMILVLHVSHLDFWAEMQATHFFPIFIEKSIEAAEQTVDDFSSESEGQIPLMPYSGSACEARVRACFQNAYDKRQIAKITCRQYFAGVQTGALVCAATPPPGSVVCYIVSTGINLYIEEQCFQKALIELEMGLRKCRIESLECITSLYGAPYLAP